MRFRTQISNPGLMLKIIKSLKQTATSCVLKLSPEVVGFIVTGPEVGPEGVQIWSQIKVSTLFEQYRIESRQSNEIHLELSSLDSITKALRSAEAAMEGSSGGGGRGRSGGVFGGGGGDYGDAAAGGDGDGTTGVVMKLAKKNDRAVLVFEIRAFTNAGHPLQVNHDVGVTVLAPIKVKELREPCCPTPDLFITLPSLAMLKGLANRLSHLAPRVTVAGNSKGTLQFSVENDGMQLDTTWNNLQIPPFTTSSSTNVEADTEEGAAPREASQLVQSTNPEAAAGSQQQQQGNGNVNSVRGVQQETTTTTTSDQMYQVTIGTKSLLRFLSTNVSNSGTIACICDDYCLICYIYIGDVADNAGVLTIFIPKMQD